MSDSSAAQEKLAVWLVVVIRIAAAVKFIARSFVFFFVFIFVFLCIIIIIIIIIFCFFCVCVCSFFLCFFFLWDLLVIFYLDLKVGYHLSTWIHY